MNRRLPIAALLAMLALSALAAPALSAAERRLSLAEALELAASSNPDLKDAGYQLESARQSLGVTEARALPTLRGYVSYLWMSDYASLSIPAGMTTITREMGQNDNWKFGLSGSWSLWAWGRTDRLLAMDRHAVNAVSKDLETRRRAVLHTTRVLYYGALYTRELVRLAEESRKWNRDRLVSISASYTNGSTSRLEWRQVVVDAADADVAARDAAARHEIGLLNLKNYLNLPAGDGLSLASSLTDEYARVSAGAARGPGAVRADEESMQARIAQAEEAIRLARTAYLPAVSLSAGWELSDPFLQQPNKWGSNLTLGLSLSVPLLDFFETKSQVKKAEAERDRMLNALDKLRWATRLEESDARLRIATLAGTIDAKRDNLARSRENFLASDAAYRSGSLALIDLSARELTMRRIETDYYAAVYEYLAARSNLDRITF